MASSTSLKLTWSGSEGLFEKCKEIVLQRLQQDILWKRGDNVLPYQTKLNSDFVAFSPEIVKCGNLTTAGTLCSIPPLCHFYFTEVSNVEKLKVEVRPKLSEWLASLNSPDCANCLVIFDSALVKETKVRNLIIDRLKTEFPKLSSRILQINLAQKKGIPLLLRHVTEIVQQSLDELLHFYDAALKNDQDSCLAPDWNFGAYFINQMQLSQLYICLNMFDQAIAPVDEVDATLALLVSHFAESCEKPVWLRKLFNTDGHVHFSIKNLIENKNQELIHLYESVQKEGLQFLNHDKVRLLLFACVLNIFLKKNNLSFNPVINLDFSDKKLEKCSKNGICEFLLDVGFKTIQKINDENKGKSVNKSFGRLLWLDELLTLADECGEIYDVTNSIEALCKIWINLCHEADDIKNYFEEHPSAMEGVKTFFTPHLSDGMKGCLDSVNNFDAQYVKWHESALALLKHKSWNNFANLICLNLANFYKSRHQYAPACAFYAKILRALRSCDWSILYNLIADQSIFSDRFADQFLPHLAPFDKFAFLCDLSCGLYTRKIEAFELLKKSIMERDKHAEIFLECRPAWFRIVDFSCSPISAVFGSNFMLNFDLSSKLPGSLEPSSAFLCMRKHRSEASFSHETEKILIFGQKITENSSDFIASNEKAYAGNLKRKLDFSDHRSISRCSNGSHNESMEVHVPVVKNGPNRLQISFQPQSSGVYCADHFHLNFDSLCLCMPLHCENNDLFTCVVDSIDFSITLEPLDRSDKLWTGVTQSLALIFIPGTIDTWSEKVEKHDDFLILSSPDKNAYFVGNSESNLYEKRISFEETSCRTTETQVIVEVFVSLDGKIESRHCTLSVEYKGWRKEFLFRFDSLLSWLFETRWIGSKILLIEFALKNHARNFDLKIVRAELDMTKKNSTLVDEKTADPNQHFSIVQGKMLNTSNMCVAAQSSFNIVWQVEYDNFEKGVVYFVYSYSDNAQTFECWASFLFTNFPVIEANCQIASESAVCRVDSPCDFVVSLKAQHIQLKCAELNVRLCLTVPGNEKGEKIYRELAQTPCATPLFWHATNQNASVVSNNQSATSCHVTLKENGLGQAIFRLTPCHVGYLPCPYVEVDVLAPPGLAGQCRTYVRSMGKQIHVLTSLSRPKIENFPKNKSIFS